MTDTIFGEKSLFEVYSFVACTTSNQRGRGVYDLYCSQPPGGDRDVFASPYSMLFCGKTHKNIAACLI